MVGDLTLRERTDEHLAVVCSQSFLMAETVASANIGSDDDGARAGTHNRAARSPSPTDSAGVARPRRAGPQPRTARPGTPASSRRGATVHDVQLCPRNASG